MDTDTDRQTDKHTHPHTCTHTLVLQSPTLLHTSTESLMALKIITIYIQSRDFNTKGFNDIRDGVRDGRYEMCPQYI